MELGQTKAWSGTDSEQNVRADCGCRSDATASASNHSYGAELKIPSGTIQTAGGDDSLSSQSSPLSLISQRVETGAVAEYILGPTCPDAGTYAVGSRQRSFVRETTIGISNHSHKVQKTAICRMRPAP